MILSRRAKEDALRWGIIGTGYMSHLFSKAIIGSKTDQLYAVASRSIHTASRFAAKYRASKYYDSIPDMLDNPEIDVVYIATPVECHYEQVKMSLQSGKNVLCEKPLTFSPDEAELLFNIAKKNNLFLMEGMWTRCLPTLKKAKEILESGVIGGIQFVRADINKRVSFEHIRKHFGVLYDYGIYGVSFMQYVLGKNIQLENFETRICQGFVTDLSALFSADDIKGSLNVMSSLSAPSKAIIICEKGSIEFDTPFNRTNHIAVFDLTGKKIYQYSYKYSCEGFEHELMEVHDNIKSRRVESNLIPTSETIECLRILKEIQHAK